MLTERRKALTAQFLANRHQLLAFIYGLVRNTPDAEDIFQEVWVRLHQALEDGTDIQNQARWCRATAKNLMLHYWRDRRTEPVIVDQELVDLVESAFLEQDAHQELWEARRQALAECVQTLPDKSKQLLRLKYEVGHTVEAVAQQLHQSAASIMMALSRLRRALRECAEQKLRLTDTGA